MIMSVPPPELVLLSGSWLGRVLPLINEQREGGIAAPSVTYGTLFLMAVTLLNLEHVPPW